VKSELFRFGRRAVRQGSWPLLQRYVVGPKIFDLPAQSIASKSPYEFHIVAGMRQELMLHWCLRSLLNHSDRPIAVFLHSDGTLSPTMISRAKCCFPGLVVVEKEQADAIVENELAKFPCLRRLRSSRETAWVGIKAVDPFLFGTSDDVYFIDTDVIVLAPPVTFFDARRTCWSKDSWWSLDLTPEELLSYSSRPFPQLNTGIGKLSRRRFRPEVLERYLYLEQHVRNDQILLALLTVEGDWELLDEELYGLASEVGTKGRVAKHYTTPFRFLFWEEGVPTAARDLKVPLSHWLTLRP
jgi:hypothetical protein